MDFSDDFLQIDTPENVAFDYEVSGIGSRFLAALIDTLAIITLLVAVGLLVIVVIAIVGSVSAISAALGEAAFGLILGIISLMTFAILWGYYIAFETLWSGQTLGKRAIGLRVIRIDGTPIGFVESLIRNLVRIIDFLPAAYGAGVLCMFFQRDFRRLGDLAAGTLVVFEKDPVSLDAVLESGDKGAANIVVPTELADYPVEQLKVNDRELIGDFLRRWRSLSVASDMSSQLMAMAYERMQATPPTLGFYDRIRHLGHLLYLADNPIELEALRAKHRTELEQATAAELYHDEEE